MDAAQYYIDKNQAQFILSGSSARKLKHGPSVNLLPGRVTAMRMSPFAFSELNAEEYAIEDLLLYGTLPRVLHAKEQMDKESELQSYVHTYLQDEIQAEGVVKKLGSFAKFLLLAAGESGKIVNFSNLSQDIGIASTTVQSYYQILDDCMMVHRIDPITKTTTKRRLINAPRYLFFDLGVRRVAAGEGYSASPRQLGELFEQWVGLELINLIHSTPYFNKLYYWRDSAGPEVDYILDTRDQWIPLEVKYKADPFIKDAKHLLKFMKDYNVPTGYIICSVHKRIIINKNPKIIALPWQEIPTFLAKVQQ